MHVCILFGSFLTSIFYTRYGITREKCSTSDSKVIYFAILLNEFEYFLNLNIDIARISRIIFRKRCDIVEIKIYKLL